MININLTGKKVLVTGGSRGIGRACVKLLCDAGSEVIYTYNNDIKASDRLVTELKNKNVQAFKISFNKADKLQKELAVLTKQAGGFDIIINNAGIWERGASDEMDVKDWEKTIEINLTSTFVVCKVCIPYMKKRKWGRIINISSTAGQRGEAFYSHYAASKGGIISFTKSLADELGKHNINVNCVAPGWVLTDMTRSVLSDKKTIKNIRNNIPLGRIASPEDIAGSVLFLASNFANHITGEVINVNGGSVLCG
ncbi:MAG: SDR family oxidoreductase [Ignavibacteriales bacterium]|nr:MAG: SDR family oxidoreductase [Ignavibacteriales bacterium]